LIISNSGDFDLTINSMVINDDIGNITTLSNSTPSFPITLTPGKSTAIPFYVTGNNIGTFSGNIAFTNHIGYFGYANTIIPTTVNVLPDYSGIALVGDSPTLTAYKGDDVTSYSYSGYTTQTFTVPSGVTSMQVVLTGAGGGGGGNDSHAGAPGGSGYTLSGRLAVTEGDVISLYVGGGGGNGASGSGNAGGAGGPNDAGYSGGNGSNAGPGGWSGSGGGGGGATVLKKNGTTIVVAAGGGGGGGGGNYSYGYGQVSGQNGSSHAGASGAYKGGDGGGAGGGGGGNPGGIAGPLNGGDSGGYSGSNGYNLVPPGFTVTSAGNGGGIYAAGGSGSAAITESGLFTSAAQTITIQNVGNGANLNIQQILTSKGLVAISNLSTDTVGYDFNTYTGNTAQFTITPYSTLGLGTYTDKIIIYSDAKNAPVYNIPITITVKVPNGNMEFATPGTYYWTVPAHVHYINVFEVAGGGAGGQGLSTDGGGGGGGGSGGYSTYRDVKVTPGEVLTITVGAGGLNTNSGSTRRVFPVSHPAYSSFTNTYGVWTSSDAVSPVNEPSNFSRLWTATHTGTYTLLLSADNYAQLFIDGALAGSSGDFQSTSSFTFAAAQGNRVVTISALNYGGPASVAAVIKDDTDTIVWTTRDLLDPGSGQAGEATTVSGSFGTLVVYGGPSGGSATQDVYYYNSWYGDVGGDGNGDGSAGDGGSGGGDGGD
jgi:hypothetical protein